MQNQTAILIGSFQTDTLTLSEHAVFMKLIEVGYSDVLIILTDQKPQLIDPVPAHLVGIYEYTKFNNVESENLNFKSMTISAIARMYRQELEFKLLTEEERRAGKSIEFALNALIELDTNTKMNYYKTMRNDLSVLSSNQIALFEGLPTSAAPPNGKSNTSPAIHSTNPV